jgi:hypothetical protein
MGRDTLMYYVVISDDNPGFREHFYKGPISKEDGEDFCKKYNAQNVSTTWCAYLQQGETPKQFAYEENYANYLWEAINNS